MPTSAPTTPPAAVEGHPKRWLILAVLLAVECMDLIDGTIVNVAAPSIRDDLGTGDTGLQWVLAGYALAFAVGLIPSGRLGDIVGRRRMFFIGLLGFTASSATCGFAPATGWLVGARLVQGLFAAAMIPQGFGIIRSVFPKEEIPKAFGVFGPVIGLSAVLGPIIGGVLVDADLLGSGWRAVFLINVPIGAVALVTGRALVPESRSPLAPTLDVLGSAIVAVASFLLVYPLIQGRESDWAPWTFASIAAGIAALVAFGLHIRAADRPDRHPIVTPALFGKRPFVAGLVMIAVFFGGMIGMMLSFSLYLQVGQGFGPAHAGLTTGPWSLGMAIGAGLSGAVLANKLGRHVLHIGAVIGAAGAAFLLAVVHHAGAGVSTAVLVAPQLVMGAGCGLLVAPLFSFILNAVDDDEVGSASGTLNAVQQLAGALGVAVIGTVFFQVVERSGFVAGLERSLQLVIGTLAATFVLAFLLPMRVRPDEVH